MSELSRLLADRLPDILEGLRRDGVVPREDRAPLAEYLLSTLYGKERVRKGVRAAIAHKLTEPVCRTFPRREWTQKVLSAIAVKTPQAFGLKALPDIRIVREEVQAFAKSKEHYSSVMHSSAVSFGSSLACT